MNSPDFVVPEDEHYEKNESLEKLGRIKSDVIQIAKRIDSTQTSPAFEFPVYGYLTGIKPLALAVYRARKHIH